jgi:hypothetical protein
MAPEFADEIHRLAVDKGIVQAAGDAAAGTD